MSCVLGVRVRIRPSTFVAEIVTGRPCEGSVVVMVLPGFDGDGVRGSSVLSSAAALVGVFAVVRDKFIRREET